MARIVPAPDQETVQPLAGPLEVNLGAVPAAGQLAIGLLGRRGGKDLRQLPGGELTEQLLQDRHLGRRSEEDYT